MLSAWFQNETISSIYLSVFSSLHINGNSNMCPYPCMLLRTNGWNGHEHGHGRSVALHVAPPQSDQSQHKGGSEYTLTHTVIHTNAINFPAQQTLSDTWEQHIIHVHLVQIRRWGSVFTLQFIVLVEKLDSFVHTVWKWVLNGVTPCLAHRLFKRAYLGIIHLYFYV